MLKRLFDRNSYEVYDVLYYSLLFDTNVMLHHDIVSSVIGNNMHDRSYSNLAGRFLKKLDFYRGYCRIDDTLRKLENVRKSKNQGWRCCVQIDEGVHSLYEWYLKEVGINLNHK